MLLLLSLLQSNNVVRKSAELNAPFLPLIEACSSSRVWMVRRGRMNLIQRRQIRSIAAYAAAGLLSPIASVDRAVKLLSEPARSENEVRRYLPRVADVRSCTVDCCRSYDRSRCSISAPSIEVRLRFG